MVVSVKVCVQNLCSPDFVLFARTCTVNYLKKWQNKLRCPIPKGFLFGNEAVNDRSDKTTLKQASCVQQNEQTKEELLFFAKKDTMRHIDNNKIYEMKKMENNFSDPFFCLFVIEFYTAEQSKVNEQIYSAFCLTLSLFIWH